MEDWEKAAAWGVGWAVMSQVNEGQNEEAVQRGEQLTWSDRHFLAAAVIGAISVLGGFAALFFGTNYLLYGIRDVTGISPDSLTWWYLLCLLLGFASWRYLLAEGPAGPGTLSARIRQFRPGVTLVGGWLAISAAFFAETVVIHFTGWFVGVVAVPVWVVMSIIAFRAKAAEGRANNALDRTETGKIYLPEPDKPR